MTAGQLSHPGPPPPPACSPGHWGCQLIRGPAGPCGRTREPDQRRSEGRVTVHQVLGSPEPPWGAPGLLLPDAPPAPTPSPPPPPIPPPSPSPPPLPSPTHTLALSFFSVWVRSTELVDCTSLGSSVSASSVPKACSICAVCLTRRAKLSMACGGGDCHPEARAPHPPGPGSPAAAQPLRRSPSLSLGSCTDPPEGDAGNPA